MTAVVPFPDCPVAPAEGCGSVNSPIQFSFLSQRERCRPFLRVEGSQLFSCCVYDPSKSRRGAGLPRCAAARGAVEGCRRLRQTTLVYTSLQPCGNSVSSLLARGCWCLLLVEMMCSSDVFHSLSCNWETAPIGCVPLMRSCFIAHHEAECSADRCHHFILWLLDCFYSYGLEPQSRTLTKYKDLCVHITVSSTELGCNVFLE